MNERRNYIGKVMEFLMKIVKVRDLFFPKALVLLFLLFSFTRFQVNAQDSYLDEKTVSSFAYDEIPVMVMVEGYQNFYVNAIYANNDLLYIDVAGLFQTLGIPCVILQKGDSISGFIENESREYLINYKSGQIVVDNKIFNSNGGLVKEMGTLFIESSLFAKAFGISLLFNYRTLTILLKSDFELPVIKQQRIEKMRTNISKIKGEVIADTVINRNYHLFRFGMVDWLVGSYQSWNKPSDNRIGLGVGAELFHGEADVSVLYYDRRKFDNRELFYLWRWVDNDNKIIKQAQLGRISNQTISFINAPLIGGTIRNSPTTVRKATGYYTINEFTEPNWTVELYINNILVDFTKADASGLFVFKVPNVYGYTTLKLKFYGPLGEERTEERTMNVPYTIMPAHEFEYSLSAGIVQDSCLSRFGRGEFNYGANRYLTIGGGFEFLSSIPNGALIPFVRTTMQPLSRLTITGEYAHGVKTRGLLDYYFWKDALLEIDFTRYVEGQLATRFNALQERKVKLSLPFRVKKIIGFSKLEFSQFVYNEFNYNVTNLMVSAYYRQFSASTSAQFNWIDNKRPYAIADLSLSYRLGKGYLLRPSAQYNVSDGKFILYKAAIEKSIPRGYITLAYERNLMLNDHFISLNFRFDLSFARTSTSISQSRDHVYTSEIAQGSLAFGSGKKYLHTSINSSVSKGGISLYPFLDLNHNGIFDAGEHFVKLTSVRVSGSKAIISGKDSIVRIADLNAFTNCLVEFSDNDLDNIAWRFKNKRYQVLIDPNQFKRVDVPIISVGEVNGMVYMNKYKVLQGIGRILVKFYDRNSSELIAESLSESDGYISYMGLEPGDYVARVDSAQLSNLDITADPPQTGFTIKSSEEGDIVSDIDFVLHEKEIKEVINTDFLPPLNIKKDTISNVQASYRNGDIIEAFIHEHTAKDSIYILKVDQASGENNQIEVIWGEYCNINGNYCIQCGAFSYINNAMRMASYIKESTGLAVGIVLQNGFYKVRVGCVAKKNEAVEIRKFLLEKSIGDDMFIVIRKKLI